MVSIWDKDGEELVEQWRQYTFNTFSNKLLKMLAIHNFPSPAISTPAFSTRALWCHGGTIMHGWKTREYKSRHQVAGLELSRFSLPHFPPLHYGAVPPWHHNVGVENAGVEISAPSSRSAGLELPRFPLPRIQRPHANGLFAKFSWVLHGVGGFRDDEKWDLCS